MVFIVTCRLCNYGDDCIMEQRRLMVVGLDSPLDFGNRETGRRPVAADFMS